MAEEEPTKIPEPSFLEQVKAEREALEKVRDENKVIVAELRELRGNEILSGKTDAGQKEEKPKEETNAEYAQRVTEGKLNG